MANQTSLKILFNIAGVLIGIIVIGYVLFAAFSPETEVTCREAYPGTTQLSLRSASDELLTSIELQARAGAGQWGTLRNASIVPEGPGGAALQIKLATLPQPEGGAERATNGVHFIWKLAALASASSVCLSYQVWLPDDFDFEVGGVLPGVAGGNPEALDNGDRFATRTVWGRNGGTELQVAAAGGRFQAAGGSHASFTAGHWTRVDQEVVLNAPDKEDGSVRMWIDGRLAGESNRLVLRKDASAKLTGVRVDVGYRRNPEKPGMLRLSAFQLAWR